MFPHVHKLSLILKLKKLVRYVWFIKIRFGHQTSFDEVYTPLLSYLPMKTKLILKTEPYKGAARRLEHVVMTGMRQRHMSFYSNDSLRSDDNYSLLIENYKFYNTIGEGAYCKVRVVQERRTKKFYALKYMPKNQPPNRLRTVVQERKVLSTVRHPFLSNLRYAFQSNNFLFMVIDLINGGDLRYYLKRYTLSEAAIRIIIGELCCVTDYLHELGIVHRDIKPENILLDNHGHIHLGDFNVAVELSCDNPVIRGVSGTFSYLAPEMQEGAAYTEQVDWWAVGIVFYECVYGKVPFRAKTREAMLRLMTRGPEFPKTDPPVSTECMNAIQRFFVLFPSERVRECNEIFELEFFKGLSRQSLEDTGSRACQPAFIPNKNSLSEVTKINRSKVLGQELINWKTKSKPSKQNKNEKKEKMVTKYHNRLKQYGGMLSRLLAHSTSIDDSKVDYMYRVEFEDFNHERHNTLDTMHSLLNEKLSPWVSFTSFNHEWTNAPTKHQSILSNRASRIFNILKTDKESEDEKPPGIIALHPASKGGRLPVTHHHSHHHNHHHHHSHSDHADHRPHRRPPGVGT